MKHNFPKTPTQEQGMVIEACGYDRWSYLVVEETEDVLTICARIDDHNVIRISKETGERIGPEIQTG